MSKRRPKNEPPVIFVHATSELNRLAYFEPDPAKREEIFSLLKQALKHEFKPKMHFTFANGDTPETRELIFIVDELGETEIDPTIRFHVLYFIKGFLNACMLKQVVGA